MTRLVTTLLVLATFGTAIMAADAVDGAKAKPYPLTTCVVSGDKLGDMGDAVVITREGREIKLCCKGCIKDFDKDPAKFIKKLDDADKAKVEQPAGAGKGTAHGCCP